MSSKLSDRDKILLKAGGTFVPGTRKYEGGIYGNSEDNDYVILSVIEPATDRVILTKEIEPRTEGDRIIVKPGVDLRNMGFVSGRFDFKYEFFRTLAGSDKLVLVNTKEQQSGEIYEGPYYINSKGEYFSGAPSDTNIGTQVELKPTKMNYEVADIATARDEIRIRARNIKDDVYKEDLYDRAFAFKNVVVDDDYRTKNGREPKLRFYNPFNPDMSSTANQGFNAGTGGPPVDDDPTATHIILEDGGGFFFKDVFEGATIRIKNAYVIGEVETLLITDRNILTNPSGDVIKFDDALNPLKPSGVYDVELHTDAISVEAWSDGVLPFQSTLDDHYGTSALGTHAKWVQAEGRNGGSCIKFVDQNAIYRNDSLWPGGASVHRPLVITTQLPSISNYGVEPGQDLFHLRFYQKSSNVNKGASIRIKYATGFGLGEARPTGPPEGYHIPGSEDQLNDQPLNAPDGYVAEPTEAMPSTELQDGLGEDGLSPGKQWFVSSIQSGMYVWEPNYDRFNTSDGSQDLPRGIRKVGIEDPGAGNPETIWVWRGTAWTPKTPPNIAGCNDPRALNYQSYATEMLEGSCVYQQSVLADPGNFDVVFRVPHNTFFHPDKAPWNTFNGNYCTFFMKYDETLGDYHIWQSKFGGSEQSVNYGFGVESLFGGMAQSSNHSLGDSSIAVGRDTTKDIVTNSRSLNYPGALALMTHFGKIVDIEYYDRPSGGGKKKVLLAFILFNQEFREHLIENGAIDDQEQGCIMEIGSHDKDYKGFTQIETWAKEIQGQGSIGNMDEFRHAVMEDHGNNDNPRFWFLNTNGVPERVKAQAGSGIVQRFSTDEDYFKVWSPNLGDYDAIFGDKDANRMIGISGEQVFFTENSVYHDITQFSPGSPKQISEAYPGVGVKDLYVKYGCANPFANNYGEIGTGDQNSPQEDAGENPITGLLDSVNNSEVGDVIPWPFAGADFVEVHTENVNATTWTWNSPGNGLTFNQRTKEFLLNRLNTLSLNDARVIGAPNINGGNCDFSVSNDPLRDGTLSPGGKWKWDGFNAVWVYQGASPASLTYGFADIIGSEEENYALNDTENVWKQFEGTAQIPTNILINEPMEFVVEGHRVGGTLGNSSQGIVWVDDFDLRFQKPGETSQQNLFADYIGNIVNVEGTDIVKLDKSFDEVGQQVGALQTPTNTGRTQITRQGLPGDVTKAFNNFEIRYRVNDEEELRTYLEVRGQKYLTTNFKIDTIEEPDYPHGVVYKLYTPLDSDVSPFDGVKIVKEMLEPYQDSVDLIDYVPQPINGTVLLSPKLEDSDGPIKPRATDFKKEDDILSSNSFIKEALQDKVLSGSMDDTELNVEYEKGFKEFVHFSSAEKRVRNFKYKLQLIESYAVESASSAALTQASYDTDKKEVDTWHSRIRDVKNSFDGFESYMYYQSSSYATSSTGQVYDNAWPKRSGTGTMNNPYVLYSVSQSDAVNWFDRQITSSSLYDTRNGNYLLNNTPEFVQVNDNQAYLDFLKMTGHFFDKIWLFTKHMSQVNDRRPSANEGLSKQLYYSLAKSLGWSMHDGKDLVDLPNYLLGQRASGSVGTFQEIERTEQDISREIWSRIVSNMPYFLKTKGTVRALKGLINCYGIPSSVLRVREYGGPDSPSSINYAIDRKYTKALGFQGSQKVTFNWQIASASVAGDTPGYPDTIEWRFKAPYSQDQFIWHSKDKNMGIVMKDNGNIDNIGSLVFFLSGSGANRYKAVSSSEMPIYDNEFYSAMIRRTTHSASIDDNVDYNLVVKKYDAGIDRFQYVSSTTLNINGANAASQSYNQAWETSGTFTLGGSSTWSGAQTGSLDWDGNAVQRYSGSLMEVRIWNEVLNTGSFDNHANNPKAYDGNTISSSYESIVSRYSFDDDKDLNADTSIADVSAKTTETQNGVAVGWGSSNGNTFHSVVDRTKSLVPNLGPSKISMNKMRIENDLIRPEFKFISGSDGQYRELQSEVPIGRGRYDFAPNDDNKVGIYFSPSDAINQDIIESLANINFNNYLGDPRDLKEETYRGLSLAQDKYWQKYNAPFNFWQYLKLLKTYDQSIFPQLKKLIPARANARLGILIEPNMLERGKEIMGKPPTFTERFYSDTIYMTGSYVTSASYEGAWGQPYSPSSDTHFDNINKALTYYNNHNPSESAVRITGESKYYQGVISQSRLENFGHSIHEMQGKAGNYLSASVTFGDPFKDQQPIQAYYSSSRKNPRKGKINLFYSGSGNEGFVSASYHMPYSFSYEPAEVNVPADSSTAMRRLFFEGVKNTKLTTIDGLEPVVVKLTSPTRIITKEPGDSKLDIE